MLVWNYPRFNQPLQICLPTKLKLIIIQIIFHHIWYHNIMSPSYPHYIYTYNIFHHCRSISLNSSVQYQWKPRWSWSPGTCTTWFSKSQVLRAVLAMANRSKLASRWRSHWKFFGGRSMKSWDASCLFYLWSSVYVCTFIMICILIYIYMCVCILQLIIQSLYIYIYKYLSLSLFGSMTWQFHIVCLGSPPTQLGPTTKRKGGQVTR